MADKEKTASNLSRREFLKVSGIASAALSLAGVAAAGIGAGKDFDSFTGWEDIYEGSSQFFNRKPYEVDKPTYEVDGPTRRTDARVEGRGHFGTLAAARKGSDDTPGWKPEDGIDALPEHLAAFYRENPRSLEMALYRQDVLEPL